VGFESCFAASISWVLDAVSRGFSYFVLPIDESRYIYTSTFVLYYLQGSSTQCIVSHEVRWPRVSGTDGDNIDAYMINPTLISSRCRPATTAHAHGCGGRLMVCCRQQQTIYLDRSSSNQSSNVRHNGQQQHMRGDDLDHRNAICKRQQNNGRTLASRGHYMLLHWRAVVVSFLQPSLAIDTTVPAAADRVPAKRSTSRPGICMHASVVCMDWSISISL
jgi:hypothetical protein